MQAASAASGATAAMLAALYREVASATEAPALAAVLRKRAEQLEQQQPDQSCATAPS